jgi:hypothetical protein
MFRACLVLGIVELLKGQPAKTEAVRRRRRRDELHRAAGSMEPCLVRLPTSAFGASSSTVPEERRATNVTFDIGNWFEALEKCGQSDFEKKRTYIKIVIV